MSKRKRRAESEVPGGVQEDPEGERGRRKEEGPEIGEVLHRMMVSGNRSSSWGDEDQALVMAVLFLSQKHEICARAALESEGAGQRSSEGLKGGRVRNVAPEF